RGDADQQLAFGAELVEQQEERARHRHLRGRAELDPTGRAETQRVAVAPHAEERAPRLGRSRRRHPYDAARFQSSRTRPASACARSTPASAASCSIRRKRSLYSRAQLASADSASTSCSRPSATTAASADPNAAS